MWYLRRFALDDGCSAAPNMNNQMWRVEYRAKRTGIHDSYKKRNNRNDRNTQNKSNTP